MHTAPKINSFVVNLDSSLMFGDGELCIRQKFSELAKIEGIAT